MSGVIVNGDALEKLREMPSESVHCCVTSPPYWGLRDYQVDGQLGLEKTPQEYVAKLTEIFREVRRVLRPDGCLWLNLGDSYARTGGTDRKVSEAAKVGSTRNTLEQMSDRTSNAAATGLKEKDLVGIPWRVALALQDDGWYLRQDIIWQKPNPMPESVTDRCTKAHEYLFLLTKEPKYYFDSEAIKEPAVGNPSGNRERKQRPGADTLNCGNQAGSIPYEGGETRNRRSVWTVATQPFKEAHFATFPPKLIEPCVLAGTSEKGCCRSCGTPFRRVVSKQRVATRPGNDTKITGDPLVDGNRDPLRHVTKTTTTGWEQECKCVIAIPKGCTVLDPFFGAGTTGLVAEKLGREWIGIELNRDYAEMAVRRIQGCQR